MARSERRIRTSRGLAAAGALSLVATGLAACGAGELEDGSSYARPTATSAPIDTTPMSQATTDPEVRITNPKPGAEVSYEQEIRGSAGGFTSDLQLWAVVKPVGAAKYYPQVDSIPSESWTSWTAHVRFGTSASTGIGTKYKLLMVIATTKAGNNFQYYLASKTAGSDDGLSSLPRGVRVISEVTVVRR